MTLTKHAACQQRPGRGGAAYLIESTWEIFRATGFVGAGPGVRPRTPDVARTSASPDPIC